MSTKSRANSHLSPHSASFDAQNSEEDSLFDIPFESLVRLSSPNDPFGFAPTSRGRDPEVATLYSAASIMSVPQTAALRPTSNLQHQGISPSPIRTDVPSKMGTVDDTTHAASTARADFDARELASDAVPLYSTPDDIVRGDYGLVRSIILNDRIHALTVDISGEVAIWDIVRGMCLGRYPREDVAAASHCGSTAGSNGSERERSPREALEAVRERIEGEAVVAPWSSVDTKTGVLTVHVNEKCFEAEIYADEAGFGPDRRSNDELRCTPFSLNIQIFVGPTHVVYLVNIGKLVLRNLFIGFIREEQRIRRKQSNTPHELPVSQKVPPNPRLETNGHSSHHHSSSDVTRPVQATKPYTDSTVISSAKMVPAIAPSPISSTVPAARPSPLITPLIPIYPTSKDTLHLPSIPQSPMGSHDATSMSRHTRAQTTESGALHSPVVTSRDEYFAMRFRQSSAGPSISDDWGVPGKHDPAVPQTPQTPQTPLTPGAGLMGRLKSFGGKVGARRGSADAVPPSPTAGPAIPEPKFEVRFSRHVHKLLILIVWGCRTGLPPPQRDQRHIDNCFYLAPLHRHHPAKRPTSTSIPI